MLTQPQRWFAADCGPFPLTFRGTGAFDLVQPTASVGPDLECQSGPADTAAETDAHTFVEMSTPHLPAIRGLLRGMLHHDADAEDALQETLLQALSNWHQLRSRGSFRPWLIQIALNEACKMLHRKPWWIVKPVAGDAADNQECFRREAPDPRENPAELLEHREADALIARKLATLPARKREVLVLRDIEDVPSAAAAKRLGLSKARARAALHRARARLREDLGPLTRLSAAIGSHPGRATPPRARQATGSFPGTPHEGHSGWTLPLARTNGGNAPACQDRPQPALRAVVPATGARPLRRVRPPLRSVQESWNPRSAGGSAPA